MVAVVRPRSENQRAANLGADSKRKAEHQTELFHQQASERHGRQEIRGSSRQSRQRHGSTRRKYDGTPQTEVSFDASFLHHPARDRRHNDIGDKEEYGGQVDDCVGAVEIRFGGLRDRGVG